MKRLIAVISGLLVLPAFAEIAPAYYYEELMAQYPMETDMEFVDDELISQDASDQVEDTEPVTPVVPTAVSPRNASGRASTSRAITSATTTSGRNVATRNVSNATTARTVSTRTVVPTRTVNTSRTATTSRGTATRGTTARATATNTVTNRPATTVRSTGATTGGVVKSQPGVTTRESTTRNNAANTARASIVQMDTVNTPLYIGNSSRVSVNQRTNVTSRIPTIRVGSGTVSATSTSATTESVSATTAASLDELAQLTDYCKAQYVACMDNFCNVLDDNQGRCSCSANLSNYADTEAALKQATEDLQEVALQIQYIGLSADEVETLFTQTEAELQMQSTTDNSQLKNDLDKIKDMIIDVKSGSPTTSSGLSFDLSGLLDFTIDSTGFDLTSLLGSMGGNNNSISNQRGETLYKTAAARCKAAVLDSCSAQGVDTKIITNAYDLEIDKACIAYERALTDSNDQMSSTVRNAKSVLQRARLLVAQQKNQYDLRGCITELDNCMQDDFVCGDDYENCLDPTGKYIVNGEIVVGSEPGSTSNSYSPIYETWTYTVSETENETGEGTYYAWGNPVGSGDKTYKDGTLAKYIDATVTSSAAQNTSTNMSEFLQNKIGYHDDNDGRNYGMCMSVLNRCQDITYSGNGQNSKYNPTNNVIKDYLSRTLVQIKARQDTILADYAEDCITDVASCLSQNNYQGTYVKPSDGTQGEVDMVDKIAIRACLPTITTCMSVNGVEKGEFGTGITINDAFEWVSTIMNHK